MPQSLAKVIVHITYSTKHRKPWLSDAVFRSELYAYNATILKQEVCKRHGIPIDERYVWD